MSESEAAATAAPPSPLEDDDLLREILLRLPKLPSSLPRASAVCKRWRRLVMDPRFLHSFRAHHQKERPPILGVFEYGHEIKFHSILDPPNCIPPERFSLGRYSNPRYNIVLGCRHGRVLIKDWAGKEIIVCDPITSKQHRVSILPEINKHYLNGAVVCAAGDQGHVHGGCHSYPFKVVLVSEQGHRPVACVYCSETGIWGGIIISTEASRYVFDRSPGILVGNVLYWPSRYGTYSILEFDLDCQNLTVIKGPCCINNFVDFQIIRVEDDDVGLTVFSCRNLQVWQRKVDCQGVAIWLLQKNVALHDIIELPPQTRKWRELRGKFVGYDEDTDEIFLYMHYNVYMVQLKSMQSKTLKGIGSASYFYPFTSFYPPGEERAAAVVSRHEFVASH